MGFSLPIDIYAKPSVSSYLPLSVLTPSVCSLSGYLFVCILVATSTCICLSLYLRVCVLLFRLSDFLAYLWHVCGIPRWTWLKLFDPERMSGEAL